jgi:SAM-dependent methyltransferase
MEAIIRKPFQGVLNVIRFNWHFYLIAFTTILLLLVITLVVEPSLMWLFYGTILIILLSTGISLSVSWYVYDYSDLYKFNWLEELPTKKLRMVNINAGFDETSLILATKFPGAELQVFDFYNPERHTEISIERARKAYAPHPNTVQISTDKIPVAEDSIDLVCNIFALHEIRDRDERISFLRKQYFILKDEGRCIIIEHLRDIPNFLAYNIGFTHFFSFTEWNQNVSQAGFCIERKEKITPFVTVFTLKKANGDTH